MRNPWLVKAEEKKAAEAAEYYEENYVSFYTNRSEVLLGEDILEMFFAYRQQPFFYVS